MAEQGIETSYLKTSPAAASPQTLTQHKDGNSYSPQLAGSAPSSPRCTAEIWPQLHCLCSQSRFVVQQLPDTLGMLRVLKFGLCFSGLTGLVSQLRSSEHRNEVTPKSISVLTQCKETQLGSVSLNIYFVANVQNPSHFVSSPL